MTKTIIKVAVILVLIVVLLGISVMKSSISAKRNEPKDIPESRPNLNKIIAGQILDSAKMIIDSLRNLELSYRIKIDSMDMLLKTSKTGVDRNESVAEIYLDSLRELENYYRGLITSLHKLYGAGEVPDSSDQTNILNSKSAELLDINISSAADSVKTKAAAQVPAKEKTEIDR
jgi:hypothetical protein